MLSTNSLKCSNFLFCKQSRDHTGGFPELVVWLKEHLLLTGFLRQRPAKPWLNLCQPDRCWGNNSQFTEMISVSIGLHAFIPFSARNKETCSNVLKYSEKDIPLFDKVGLQHGCFLQIFHKCHSHQTPLIQTLSQIIQLNESIPLEYYNTKYGMKSEFCFWNEIWVPTELYFSIWFLNLDGQTSLVKRTIKSSCRKMNI